MSKHESEFPLAVRHSIIANDEQGGDSPIRRSLPATGELRDLTDKDLMCCEKLVTFGSFILDCEESENFAVLSETAEENDETMDRAISAAQEGLEALSSRGSLVLQSGIGCEAITGFSASCIAKESLEADLDRLPVIFTAGVEVYESPNGKNMFPVLSHNKGLGDSIYKARNTAMRTIPEDSQYLHERILEPTDETKKLFIVEAASELLPSDMYEYYRI